MNPRVLIGVTRTSSLPHPDPGLNLPVKLPIYRSSSRRQRISFEELAEILIVSVIPDSKICTQQPVRIQHNCCFIVNLTTLDSPLDVRADDLGTWKRKGSPSGYISIYSGVVRRRSRPHSLPNLFKLTRYYYNHSSSPDFHKIITKVYGKLNLISLVLYHALL